MDRLDWQHQYKRLLTAFGKKANPDQSAEYFSALKDLTAACVHDAVSSAIKDAKFWPTAAELMERGRNARHQQQPQSKAACAQCDGSTWQSHQCDGMATDKDTQRVLPLNRAHACDRNFAHAPHDFARRCVACWESPSERVA